MENGGAAGRSSNNGTSSWDFWELGIWSSSSPHVPSSSSYYAAATTPAASSPAGACFPFSDQQLMTGSNGDSWTPQYHQQHHNHHHHLTCLKLGKRQYYGEETVGAAASSATKRERPTAVTTATAAAAPRCQVDGCSKVLVDEKEYHKRHKVCEMHSKAPKVVLLGVEQRFCQQCSRFHAISEFDDAKRSCRRRLAGHNERRRKNSTDSVARNPVLESAMTGGISPYASPGCALSLLSSKASPWISTSSDFSSRSSAALNELIAENRAAVLARQLFLNPGGWHAVVSAKQQPFPSSTVWPHQTVAPQATVAHLGADGWSTHLQEAGGRNVTTLDLMQMPDSSFEIVPRRRKSSKAEEEECDDIWKSLAGTHVV